jgi:hypothetical protein
MLKTEEKMQNQTQGAIRLETQGKFDIENPEVHI